MQATDQHDARKAEHADRRNLVGQSKGNAAHEIHPGWCR
jgi:hypothetical protein